MNKTTLPEGTYEDGTTAVTAQEALESVTALPYRSQLWIFGQLAEAIDDGRLDGQTSLTPEYRERLKQALAILT